MRRLVSSSLAPLLAATLLVGCQGVNLPLTGAAAKYGQLNFTPASASTMAMLGSQAGAEGQASAATAPRDSAAGAPAPTMVAMPAPYYGGYWGNEYELVSTSEAKAGGFQGTYQQALESVVKPMVADWATDAVLRNAGGTADDKGQNVKPSATPSPTDTEIKPVAPLPPDAAVTRPAVMPVYVQPSGWRFEFASRGKRESLFFFVTADATTVVKQTYREKITDLSAAKLGSAEVIAIVTKAIQDKSIQANDPAMPAGSAAGSSGSGVAIAVPAVAPAPPMATAQVNTATPVSAGPAVVAPAPGKAPDMPSEEELTTIPAGSRWDLNLYLENLPNQGNPDGTNPEPAKTRLVWNVSMQIDYSQQTPGTGYSPAWARVDAESGALLSLSRPRKYTYATTPTAEPMPVGGGVAVSTPASPPKQ